MARFSVAVFALALFALAVCASATLQASVVKNVQTALTGETEATNKYNLMAQVAEDEGYPNVARLFKAASMAESVHIRRLKGLLAEPYKVPLDLCALADKVYPTTIENLEAAIAGETYENTTMYPSFQQNAMKYESSCSAVDVFEENGEAETVHAKLYTEALDAVKQGQDWAQEELYVCLVCGNIEKKVPGVKCPICKHNKFSFHQVF